MKILHIAGAAILALCVATASYADVDNNLASNIMKAKPSEIRLYGTLAPKGSFEEKADPLYTQLAAYRDHVADLIGDGKVTINQAQAAQVQADQVRANLDDALRACAQNNKSGKCTGDAGKAGKLLAHAKAQLTKLNRK